MFDASGLIKRVIKYLVEGLMVAIAAYAIPKRSLNMEEIGLLALTAEARGGRGAREGGPEGRVEANEVGRGRSSAGAESALTVAPPPPPLPSRTRR